jgi:membrane protease YdiL (CAAX protease family)
MRQELASLHPVIQLLIFTVAGFIAMIALVFVSVILQFVIGGGADGISLANMDLTSMFSVDFLKVLQMIQAVGLFIVPYLLYRWVEKDQKYEVSISSNKGIYLLIFGVTMFSAFPVINALASWNASLSLPEVFSGLEAWMRSTEAEAEEMIKAFMVMDSPFDLAFNLLLIAVLPAISEELFFRGFMQSVFHKLMRNVHLAVWVTAILFSAFHMQFLGFVPRMILGAVLGYAAVYSGSLLVPMLGHFINNGLAVMMTYFYGPEMLEADAEIFGARSQDWWLALLSGVLVIGGVVLMRNIRNRQIEA